VSVDPKFHPKIIGRRGTVVSKIRQDHDVQITMPDKDSERPDVVIITGLEQSATAARDDILRIVHDFVRVILVLVVVVVVVGNDR